MPASRLPLASPVGRLLAAVLAVPLGVTFTALLPPALSAGAQERTEVRCTEASYFNTGCTQDLLQSLIDDAGAEPTRIVLGFGDGSTEIMISRPVVIPAGADIEFVNLPDVAWGAARSRRSSARRAAPARCCASRPAARSPSTARSAAGSTSTRTARPPRPAPPPSTCAASS